MSYLKPARLLASVLIVLAIGCSDRDDGTAPPPTPPKTPPPSPTAMSEKSVCLNFEFSSLERSSS